MTVSITLVFLSERILLSFLCRTSGLARPAAFAHGISSPAETEPELDLQQGCSSSSSPSSLSGTASLDCLHVGFDPGRLRAGAVSGTQGWGGNVGSPHSGQHFGTRLHTKGVPCREWGIKDCFSLPATHDRLREFSDKEISCTLRVQMPLSLWGWRGWCYYLGPVQFLFVARLHFSK